MAQVYFRPGRNRRLTLPCARSGERGVPSCCIPCTPGDKPTESFRSCSDALGFSPWLNVCAWTGSTSGTPSECGPLETSTFPRVLPVSLRVPIPSFPSVLSAGSTSSSEYSPVSTNITGGTMPPSASTVKPSLATSAEKSWSEVVLALRPCRSSSPVRHAMVRVHIGYEKPILVGYSRVNEVQ